MAIYEIKYKDLTGTIRYSYTKAESRKEVIEKLKSVLVDPLNPNSKTYQQEYISVEKRFKSS